MKNSFRKQCFQNNLIQLSIKAKPVSAQNKDEIKKQFKKEIQKLTKSSEFIITGTCWVAINYYCQHIKRFKNPGVYDMDNIVKPIMASLVGLNGLLVDDVLVDRSTVNWIDTQQDDYIEIDIEYPDLLYFKKSDLIFIKSKTGWCFPSSLSICKNSNYLELIRKYFDVWNSIGDEGDYNAKLGVLPIQNFIYFNKIKDRGYKFQDL